MVLITGDNATANAIGGKYERAFSLAAEALAYAAEEVKSLPEPEQGIIMGALIFEVVTNLIPGGQLKHATKTRMLDDLVAGRVAATSPGGRVMAKVMTLLNKLRTTKMCFIAGTMVMSAQGAVPIEAVRPGMEVWARDQITKAEGWRPVLQTFTTHPEELFTLGYDTDGDGAADEELTGTGEHPFWVEDFGDFLPMRDLRPGMRLSLAREGGTAIVTGNVSKRGPPGERFTTYNFEVAEYHTYFVGSAGVWVHNTGRGPCEVIFSIYQNFRKRAGGNETQWDSLISARNAMRDDGFDLVSGTGPLSGTKIPGVYWRRTVKEVNDEMFGEVASGGMSLQKLPSHKQIKDEFKGSGIGSTAPKRLNDPDALESHHIVEKWIQTRLNLTGAKTGDDIPGFITTYTQHRAGGTTPTSIATQLQQRIGTSTDQLTISTALRETYLDHGLDDVWQVTKRYLQWKGVPTP